jgi:hypothetical protein
VHSGTHLAKEVIKATDFFGIAHSIVAITYDNASVNDTLFEGVSRYCFQEMENFERSRVVSKTALIDCRRW